MYDVWRLAINIYIYIFLEKPFRGNWLFYYTRKFRNAGNCSWGLICSNLKLQSIIWQQLVLYIMQIMHSRHNRAPEHHANFVRKLKMVVVAKTFQSGVKKKRKQQLRQKIKKRSTLNFITDSLRLNKILKNWWSMTYTLFA